jgi:cell division transport system permease protein
VKLAFREALFAFRRLPLLSALSILTIAFSLFAFGLFGLVASNIRDTLRRAEERVEIRGFVTDATPIEQIVAAEGEISALPQVEHVAYISPDSALTRAQRELGEFSDVFEPGVLPGSIEIRLRPGARDPAAVKRVAGKVGTYPFIDDVRYGEFWVAKLYEIRTVATVVGLVLGVAFAAVAVIIIGATIRMAVLARGREISIMRLVGATDTFVRLPFLIEGVTKGVLGGLLALGLTYLANVVINHYVLRTTFFDPAFAVLGVCAGAVIGLLGSAVSVGRHLRQV